jgi:transcriptional regulator with XRE-family HTH domain
MKTGENIRKIRDLKGFSQEYLANKLGVSQTAIHTIEASITKVTVGRLNKIAKILEVTPEQILEFSDSKIFNTPFSDNTSNNGNAVTYINVNFEKERQLYERLLAEKDQIICELKSQIKS